MTHIRILHLSDVHFGKAAEWRQEAVVADLHRDLPELLGDERPDLLAFTGDLAWSGRADELARGEAWLRAIGHQVGLGPDRWVLAPGNHDADRSAVSATIKGDQKSWLTLDDADTFRDEVARRLEPDELAGYGRRLRAWCDFTARVLGSARAVTPERPWRVDRFELGGVALGVASLCSAWASGPDEEKQGRAVLGERQVRQAADELRDVPLRLAMLHHPPDWLHQAEGRIVRELMRSRFAAVLHGHVHATDLLSEQGVGGKGAVVGAGAAYAGARWRHGFHLLELDPAGPSVRIRPFTWTERGGGRWHLDAALLPNGSDGWLGLGRLQAPVASTRPIEELAEELRSQVRQLEGMVRFVGLAVAADRADPDLERLYVPLDLEGGGKGRVPTASLVELLGQGARCMVLGEPGAGKSTFSRWLAVRLAEEGRFPVVVRARDLEGGGLVEATRALLKRRYLVDLPPGGVERLLSLPGAVLVVDGLDEGTDDGAREGLRDQVVALAGRVKCGVLLTSRPLGYDARVPEATWRHLSLAPFTRDQLRTFVDRWTAAVERDPVEQEAARASLWSALEEDPAARELASNPLMATLVGVVHRAFGQLPGNRAALYERVVETMLTSWPTRSRGRPFPELTTGIQRRALEELAWAMQEERRDDGVSWPRARVVACLGRALAGEPAVVERWFDWLATEGGILVESRAGSWTFVHLSVLEYLAARRWFKAGIHRPEELARDIAGREPLSRWSNVVMLGVASEAEDPAVATFLAALARSRTTAGLAACALVEDPAVPPTVLASVLEGADGSAWTWRRLAVRSLRHGAEVVAHLARWLRAAEADEVADTASDWPEEVDPDPVLGVRADAEVLRARLLRELRWEDGELSPLVVWASERPARSSVPLRWYGLRTSLLACEAPVATDVRRSLLADAILKPTGPNARLMTPRDRGASWIFFGWGLDHGPAGRLPEGLGFPIPSAERSDRGSHGLACTFLWLQATWRWPWGALSRTPPPDPFHAWLWHLCWWAAEPWEPTHEQAALAALETLDWPELAADVRSRWPKPNPAVLALPDHERRIPPQRRRPEPSPLDRTSGRTK